MRSANATQSVKKTANDGSGSLVMVQYAGINNTYVGTVIPRIHRIRFLAYRVTMNFPS